MSVFSWEYLVGYYECTSGLIQQSSVLVLMGLPLELKQMNCCAILYPFP